MQLEITKSFPWKFLKSLVDVVGIFAIEFWKKINMEISDFLPIEKRILMKKLTHICEISEIRKNTQVLRL